MLVVLHFEKLSWTNWTLPRAKRDDPLMFQFREMYVKNVFMLIKYIVLILGKN